MGNKGKKVSALASATADSAPRTVLLPSPAPLFGLDEELPVCLRFAFSRLYSLSTVQPARCCCAGCPACVHVSPSPQLPPTCMHPRRTISSHTCIRPPKANPIRGVLPPRDQVSPSILPSPPRCTLIAFNPSSPPFFFTFSLAFCLFRNSPTFRESCPFPRACM